MRPTYEITLAEPYEWASLTGFEEATPEPGALPLDALRGLSRHAPPEPGIYFLWRGPQLIYIGSTMDDLRGRMVQHARARLGLNNRPKYPFTHYTCMEHKLRGLQDTEYRHIATYRPPFNTRIVNTGFDCRIPVTRGSPYTPPGKPNT